MLGSTNVTLPIQGREYGSKYQSFCRAAGSFIIDFKVPIRVGCEKGFVQEMAESRFEEESKMATNLKVTIAACHTLVM